MSDIGSSSQATTIALPSNSAIDGLLFGDKWGGALGSGVTITYSFPTNFTANTYWDGAEYTTNAGSNLHEIDAANNPHGLTAGQQAQFQLALAQWSSVANI